MKHMDPIYHEDDGWWVVLEECGETVGPFHTEEDAEEALMEYRRSIGEE